MSQDNKIDLWLKRVGYISQIGTLIVMIITIFYTVIPLYRTASLEESISQKELEFKALNKKIKNFERKERTATINRYTRIVSYSCTSISRPIEELLSSNRKSDRLKNRELNILNQDIESCLKNTEYTNDVMDTLSNANKVIFQRELDLFIDKISKLRQEKINQYYAIEKKLYNNEIDINLDYKKSRSEELVEKLAKELNIPDESEEDKQKRKINSYLSRLESSFEDEIRQEIFKFNITNWDDSSEK